MKTYSDKPNVRVTVAGLQSACNTNCRYTFNTVIPTLNALSVAGNIVTIGLTDPNNM